MNVSFEGHTDTGKDEWLTDPALVGCLGPFDLDPCSPQLRPWDTARMHYTSADDGLKQPWFGRVWCNPPYGNQTGLWLQKLSLHGNGIALIFARTDTKNFSEWVWPYASGIFFLGKRLKFFHVTGKVGGNIAGAPSVLVAYGEENATILKNVALPGKFLKIA